MSPVLKAVGSTCLWRCAGEQLSTGWEPELRILVAVPEAEDAACVSLAFQSVQLLASDYMSALPPPLLHKCLQAAALYGGQQVGPAARSCVPRHPCSVRSLIGILLLLGTVGLW